MPALFKASAERTTHEISAHHYHHAPLKDGGSTPFTYLGRHRRSSPKEST